MITKEKYREAAEALALQKEMQFYASLSEGVILIEGRKGSGKTAMGVRIAHRLREYFGRPPLLDFHPLEPFGKYTYFDEARFVNDLQTAASLSRATESDMEYITKGILNQMNVELAGSTICLDEAYKYFESRRPHDPLNLAFGYFISQSRHYRSAIILMVPHRDMIDKRVRRQVDVIIRAAFNPITQIITARVTYLTSGEEPKKVRVWGPSVFPLYDSWNPIAMRRKLLNLGKAEVIQA